MDAETAAGAAPPLRTHASLPPSPRRPRTAPARLRRPPAPPPPRASASLRISFAQFVFFLAMAMASAAQPPIHDLGWDVKWLVFVALVIGLIWAPSTVFNLSGYAWLARVGAFCFVVLQQLIIVDAAYSFNHYMINCGDAGASGTMTKQMKILLLLCVLGYVVSFVGWVLMYVYYTDDQSNANSTALISVTLCMTVIFTGLQLVSDPAQGHNLFTRYEYEPGLSTTFASQARFCKFLNKSN